VKVDTASEFLFQSDGTFQKLANRSGQTNRYLTGTWRVDGKWIIWNSEGETRMFLIMKDGALEGGGWRLVRKIE